METFTANILKKQVIKRAQHFYEDFNCKVAVKREKNFLILSTIGQDQLSV